MSDARLTSLGEGKGPIVLQGAMEMEVAPFIKRLGEQSVPSHLLKT